MDKLRGKGTGHLTDGSTSTSPNHICCWLDVAVAVAAAAVFFSCPLRLPPPSSPLLTSPDWQRVFCFLCLEVERRKLLNKEQFAG